VGGEAWQQLVELMTTLSSNEPGDLASQLKRIRLFYAPLMERLYDNARTRLMDLEQLEWLAGRYPDRERFLTEITLDPPSYTEDLAGPPLLDEDFLILSTMHSAKGLEWNAVFVIHASDGNIPSDMATGRLEEIEEERRLFYVALTRAKDWLHVCYPLRYYVQARGYGDTHGYAQPTRFVSVGVRGTMESVAALDILETDLAGEGRDDSRLPMGSVTTEDIRQRLKALL
jgi:DNA helicase-2/ATP-dependent DNA helicase PcrA